MEIGVLDLLTVLHGMGFGVLSMLAWLTVLSSAFRNRYAPVRGRETSLLMQEG